MPKHDRTNPTEPKAPGVIEPGCLLTAAEARKRLNLGDWAWRQLRRNGLRVFTVGRIGYVFADDLIEFFRSVQRSK